MKCRAPGLAATLLTLTALSVATLGSVVGTARADAIPVYHYKRFCKVLAKGQPVMMANCETQEVLSYNQLRRIWEIPPSAEIQKKCYASNTPDRTTGSGSYVKFLNCIITNTGNG